MHFITFSFSASIKPLVSLCMVTQSERLTTNHIILQHSQLIALDFFFDHVDSTYGIDEDGPVPTEDVVQIPECSYVLSD